MGPAAKIKCIGRIHIICWIGACRSGRGAAAPKDALYLLARSLYETSYHVTMCIRFVE